MLILVLGENNSGKSLFAEQIIAHSPLSPRYYIATMQPCTDEGRQKVLHHRAQREGLGFVTLETPCEIDKLSVCGGSAVLLEDVSNLLSNRMFDRRDPNCVRRTQEEIVTLCTQCGLLVAVSIEGLDARLYTGETRDYIDALNCLNKWLFQHADVVFRMNRHCPILRKGDLDILNFWKGEI